MATEHENSLEELKIFEFQYAAASFLKGETTAYGVMTDWNPAEIIGIKPNLLRYLYTEN